MGSLLDVSENPAVRFNWPDETGPWEITLEWGNVADRLDVFSFKISVVGGEPITASVLRRVPFGRLVHGHRQQYIEWFEQEVRLLGEVRSLDEEELREIAELRKQFANPHRPGPKGKPMDHFQKVAEIYAEAYIRGERPTKAVAEEFHVSRDTAAKWVSVARNKLKLLGATVPGSAGGAHVIEIEITDTLGQEDTTEQGERE